MLVNELLKRKNPELYTINPNDTVYQAIEKMAEHNIGALLVMVGKDLVGIISERDYRNKVILKGKSSKTTQVKEIMTGEVIVVEPTDSLVLCMQLMTEKRIRHLPVVQKYDVVGMVSIGDVVKTIISNQKGEIDSLRSYIASSYPN